jgi:hypothetical protein|tara:strand:+ start:1077 stop:1502 length:426 start_codon:yes stop_codon:yes gene_type:complete
MIHILKLSNGDTIVGDLVSEDEKCITLNNPLELQLVNNPMTGSGLMSMYWLPIETEVFHVDIRQQHVIVLSEASKEIQKFYNNSVSNFLKRRKMFAGTVETDSIEERVFGKAMETMEKQMKHNENRMMARMLIQANTSIMH